MILVNKPINNDRLMKKKLKIKKVDQQYKIYNLLNISRHTRPIRADINTGI